MKSFKQFLFETNFPGGYYNQNGKLMVYFKSRKEKEDFDNDSRNDKKSENWTYRSDKGDKLTQAKVKSLLTFNKGAKAVGKVVSKLNPEKIADEIITQTFGDGLISQKAVDTINSSSEFIKEMKLADENIKKLDKLIQQHKNNEKIKKRLLELKKKQEERKAKLRSEYKKYQDREYI